MSAFSFKFEPLGMTALERFPSTTRRASGASTAGLDGPRPVVLLVEDDVDMRMLFRFAFERDGFFVREASDGLEALTLLQVESFDAVVMDISMPHIDGLALLRTLHGMKSDRPTTPIIVVSALGDPGVEERALSVGASLFLLKPVMPDTIIAAVRERLVVSS